MGRVVIQKERCKGCELCVDACPRHLLEMSGRINHLGYRPAEFHEERGPQDGKGCTGCTVCGIVCPETAISVYR